MSENSSEHENIPVTSGKEIGSRLKEFLTKGLKCDTIKAAAEKLHVPRSSLDRWTKGDWISKEGLSALSINHCNIHWLLTGWGEMFAPIHPSHFSNLELERDCLKDDLARARQMLLAMQRSFNIQNLRSPLTNSEFLYAMATPYSPDEDSHTLTESQVLDLTYGYPIRGCAAADDSGGTRVPDFDDVDGSIVMPHGLTFVPIIGGSMAPVLQEGHYAAVDADREGFEEDGKIVVVSILESEPGDTPEEMVGTFVKRCFRRDDHFHFTSINTFPPFSARVDHCRIWPVIGVWFAGKGRPPENF